ncbi:MAG: zinc ribbon domain-containing protein [Acutalibacteraceae bacterium]|nr:zinc ribbon domain-containing protein [Acutalibacteraceae bacterium]
MEGINSIQFDGRFNTEVVQGTYKLFTEVKFTAILNIEIADPDKFNTMFGGQLPVDLIKNDVSRVAEMTFTKMFEDGCYVDELKYKADTQADLILQDFAIAGWEARAGIRATAINNVIVAIDPQTEKMLSTMASINSVPVSAPAPHGNAIWQCACGNNNSGKFCTECGTKKPEGWVCSCGNINKGKFCTECGKPKNQ